jgi:hypothetical protein
MKILHLPRPLVNEKQAAEIDSAQVAAGGMAPSAEMAEPAAEAPFRRRQRSMVISSRVIHRTLPRPQSVAMIPAAVLLHKERTMHAKLWSDMFVLGLLVLEKILRPPW